MFSTVSSRSSSIAPLLLFTFESFSARLKCAMTRLSLRVARVRYLPGRCATPPSTRHVADRIDGSSGEARVRDLFALVVAIPSSGPPLSYNYIHLIPSRLASSRPSLVLFAIRSIDGRIVFGTLPITAFSFLIILCIPPYPLCVSPTFAFNLDLFCLT